MGTLKAMPGGYTYILGSSTGTLYIGVTSDLFTRVLQHRNGAFDGFSKKYGCKRLLYFEEFTDIQSAIAREKQLKGWTRAKKLALIRTRNPGFKDLAQLWGSQMIGPFEKMQEHDLRTSTAKLFKQP
jgi:putative endonuclease